MEAKFTKGPWQRSGVRMKLGAEDCIKVGPDGFPVAFLPIGRTPDEHADAIADANLIAAAPEMLAQLRECQAALSALLSGDPDLTARICGSTTLGNRLVHVHAAIAKALGA